LTLVNEADYDGVAQGDDWTISGLRAGTVDAPVPLELKLTAREREILLAGGLIAYARGG
jgi:hypothetical protein